MNLGDSVIDLLNRLESDPQVLKFLDSMQAHGLLLDKINFKRPNESLNHYTFTKIGLLFDANDGRIFEARFELEGTVLPDGTEICPYSGDLPFGLQKNPHRLDVLTIMGEPIERSLGKLRYVENANSSWSQAIFWLSAKTEKVQLISVFCREAITGKPKVFGQGRS